LFFYSFNWLTGCKINFLLNKSKLYALNFIFLYLRHNSRHEFNGKQVIIFLTLIKLKTKNTMKKQLLSITAIVLTAGALVLTGCSKDDTTSPVVTLNGAESVTISLNSPYTDAGATASDDKDGTIVPVASGTVDKDLTGTYIVTYTATDAAGNSGTAKRTVIVKNDAQETWAGTYSGEEVDALGPYIYKVDLVVEASTKINNEVIMNRLGGYANNNVKMNVTGKVGTVPTQDISNVGTGTATCDVHNRRTSSGNAAITTTGFTLTYSDEKIAPCSGTRTGVAAKFTKK
jgi:hypothetical protein